MPQFPCFLEGDWKPRVVCFCKLAEQFKLITKSAFNELRVTVTRNVLDKNEFSTITINAKERN